MLENLPDSFRKVCFLCFTKICIRFSHFRSQRLPVFAFIKACILSPAILRPSKWPPSIFFLANLFLSAMTEGGYTHISVTARITWPKYCSVLRSSCVSTALRRVSPFMQMQWHETPLTKGERRAIFLSLWVRTWAISAMPLSKPAEISAVLSLWLTSLLFKNGASL